MKRITLISLALIALIMGCIPCPAFAQLDQKSLYLRKADYGWVVTDTYAASDTLTVSDKTYTKSFPAFNGIIAIEGKAIFTAGTDSMKGIIYASMSQYGYPQDTMRIFALDSFKLLSATSGSSGVKMKGGNFHYRFALGGEYGMNVSFAFAPLNGVTGKLTQVVIGRQ